MFTGAPETHYLVREAHHRDLLADAARRRRLAAAEVRPVMRARPGAAGRLLSTVAALRHPIGTALVRLGERLQGTFCREPVTPIVTTRGG